MSLRTNAFEHQACSGRNKKTDCRDLRISPGSSKTKKRKPKKLLVIFAFLLAVAITSASVVWLLNKYGPENLIREIVASAGGNGGYGDTDTWPNEDTGPSMAIIPDELPSIVFDPENSLNLSQIYQRPELKNGCETTSLAMLMRYYGYSIDKSILAYNYIPREDFSNAGGVRYGPHPETAYPGDPATSKGFYCYPGPVVTGANLFLAEQSSPLQAYDISGASEEQLAQHIRDKQPVMVWVTMDYGTALSYLDFTWQLPDGKTYTPYKNLHCVVLAGVDGQTYEVCDPINGTIYISRETLFKSYQALNSMAVVIK